jgi:hypothetical protein
VIGEVLLLHASEAILDGGLPDARRLDLVGRLGGDWYCHLRPESLFEQKRPEGP